MTCVGIDPGVNGAVAVVGKDTISFLSRLPSITTKLKTKTKSGKDRTRKSLDPVALADIFRFKVFYGTSPTVIMEGVHAMPSDGGVSGFSFGTTYGVILGSLGAFGCRPTLISPASWKRYYGLIGCTKKASIELAKEAYPNQADLIKSHDLAEAVLIARWGLEKRHEKP